MKKTLIVLLAVAIVGSFVFAQDTKAPAIGKFSAWNEGVAYYYAKQGDNGAHNGWGPAWNNVNGIDQEWTFAYDGNNYGFTGTLEFGMDNFANNAINNSTGSTHTTWVTTMDNFSTYYKFFDGKAKLTVGKAKIGDYRITSFVEGVGYTRIASQEYGTLFQVYPVDGLSLAAFVAIPATATNFDYSKAINVAVGYTAAELGTFNVQYRTVDSKLDLNTSITAVKDVGIKAAYEGYFGDSGDGATNYSKLYGSAQTTMDKLTVAADVATKLIKDSNSIGVEGKVEYALSSFSVGSLVGYDDGKGVGLIGNNDGVGNVGSGNDGANLGLAGFEVYPYVVKNFDNGSYVKLGVIYAGGANSIKSGVAIPLTYNWTF